MPDKQRILVLGAYGFIGSAVVRVLVAADHDVIASGRDKAAAARVLPGIEFRHADLRDLAGATDWPDLLRDVGLVVNCAGALQDGRADDLEAVHHHAIAALGESCVKHDTAVVQISAMGADPGASTEFMRSKVRGDAALRRSGVRLHIVRPGLVIGQQAYGGTALLRMLAAVPLVQPLALPDAKIQCTGLPDLAEAVCRAVSGALPPGNYDLAEPTPRPLSEIVALTRAWLGFAPARWRLVPPQWLLRGVSRAADLLGRLGWRSPLRSTTVMVLEQGVTGDPRAYMARGPAVRTLPEVFDAMACPRAERLQARLMLLMPLMVAVLALFWLGSGLIGILRADTAADVLRLAGWPPGLALGSVLFWSGVDLVLGVGLLLRRWAAHACLAQVAVSVIYLLLASLVTPYLWVDPLGPLLKILPAAMLSLTLYPLLETR